ncbi:MAG: type II toxin-antitoxin system RelE/ParE family toxin [Chitinophagales bacterium]|nr:type II toxin-antitoxin system RelE/ParE family toxin [Chitinophagales bacterium]
MTYRIAFLPQVEQDVQDAYNWYELQLPGLGDDFLLSIDAAVNAIARNPLHYTIEFKNIRKAKARRFPFGIYFLIHQYTITVIAIIHLARHPKTWKTRTKKK